jgi:hypothetical protein
MISPSRIIPRVGRELVARIADPQNEINTSRKNRVAHAAFRKPFGMRSIDVSPGLASLQRPQSSSDPVFHTQNHCRHFLSLCYLFTFDCTQ